MKSLKLFALTVAVIFAAATANAADAVTADTKADGTGALPQKVAYVDLVKIVAEAKAAKNIEGQISKLKEKYQADAKSKENALKAREKELTEQKKALSPEAFQKKVIEFRKRVQSDQEQVARYQHILQSAYLKALEALKVETVKASGVYAKDNNISLIFPKSQLLYGFQAYDITDGVLKLLDDKVPEIKITIDEKAEKAKSSDDDSDSKDSGDSKDKPKSQQKKK